MISDTTQDQKIIHPCFQSGCAFGRIHLPVAPNCNLLCSYCSRKYDCLNESRPGVTSRVMTPEEACAYYRERSQKYRLSVAGIAGPGDPLANWPETEKTLRLIREEAPALALCLSTNGLTGAQYAYELYALGARFVTLTINAVSEECAAEIYEWVSDEHGTILRGVEGAKFLLQKQKEALQAFSSLGFHIKINMVLIPGVNEHQSEDVAKLAACFHCDLLNLIPLIPVKGTKFADWKPLTQEALGRHRLNAESHVPVMYHCQHCRADAVGYVARENI